MKTDVLIVGGGAVGSAVAYFFKTMAPNSAVVVAERDPAYSLASTPRASGGVRRLFSLPENIHLSNFGIPFFESFPETMAVDGARAEIGFKRGGYLFVVPAHARDALKANYETQRAHGVNVEWLEPDALKARFPSMNVSDLSAGTHSLDDGWLDPHSVLHGFRRKAAALGATYLAEEIVAFERDATRVQGARTASGTEIRPDVVVNAAGAWAKDICAMLGFAVPIEPMRRYEHFFQCAEPIEPLPYFKDVHRLAFRPEGHGYTGGVPTLEEPRGYNFEVDPRYFEAVVWPALAHRFPQFEKTKEIRTMPGLYDQNDLDGNVIIGPGADGLANFHMLAGFSGHGLMHAPGCGRAMAELILTGRYQTIDLTRFGWSRVPAGAPLRERGII